LHKRSQGRSNGTRKLMFSMAVILGSVVDMSPNKYESCARKNNGGSWLVTTNTQQDGSVGGGAQGTIDAFGQVFISAYQGSDYVLRDRCVQRQRARVSDLVFTKWVRYCKPLW